jgi:hypothetical protein
MGVSLICLDSYNSRMYHGWFVYTGRMYNLVCVTFGRETVHTWGSSYLRQTWLGVLSFLEVFFRDYEVWIVHTSWYSLLSVGERTYDWCFVHTDLLIWMLIEIGGQFVHTVSSSYTRMNWMVYCYTFLKDSVYTFTLSYIRFTILLCGLFSFGESYLRCANHTYELSAE